MSHDTKTGHVNRHRHHGQRTEISLAVPSALPSHVHAKRDEPIEPDDRRESVRPVSSSATICASETDDGDYETSSEGRAGTSKRSSSSEIHRAQTKGFRERSSSLSKLGVHDGTTESAIKERVIFEPRCELVENRLTRKTTYVHGSSVILVPESLAKTMSLPILKNETASSSRSTNFGTTDSILISKSSFARKKKMSMIVEKMAPLLSSYPVAISVTSSGSTSNFCDRQYDAKRRDSRTILPVLYDATAMAMINGERSEELVAEVTLHETRSNCHSMDWNRHQDAFVPAYRDGGNAASGLTTNDSKLRDVARNPFPSIKSIYFEPNPFEASSTLPADHSGATACSYRSKRRASTGMETLLKIDYELSPLRCQFSNVIGKARALGLSNARFNLDISRNLDKSESLDCSLPSCPSLSNYCLDRVLPQKATTNIFDAENQTDLADATMPVASFTAVGKPVSRGPSHTDRLYRNGLNRRQETLDLTSDDHFHARDHNLDDPRCPRRVEHGAFYLPATNIHASQGKTVLTRERSSNGRVSDNNFQSADDAAPIERTDASAAWQAWSVYGRIDASPPRLLHGTDYDSHHRCLEKTVEDPMIGNDDAFAARPDAEIATMSENGFRRGHRPCQWDASRTTCQSSNYTSKSTIVEVVDNGWCIDDEHQQATSKRSSNEHVDVLGTDERDPTVRNVRTLDGGNRDKSAPSEEEEEEEADRLLVAGDDRIVSSPSFESAEPPRDAGPERGTRISRAISTSGCAPQIRVVSVNTEFCTTVEKRCYTSRAVSPVQDLCTKDAMTTSTSMTRSSNNVILATRMSSVFIRQVHANSSTEMLRAELLSPRITPVEPDKRKRDDKITGNVVSKRTFSLKNVDSRTLEDSSRLSEESEEDEADTTRRRRRTMDSGSKHARHVQRPALRAKERITIVPIVLTDGIPEPPKTADVNFAIPRYVNKLAPELSYEIVPFDPSRKSRRMRSLSDSGNETTQSQQRTATKPTCSSEKLTDEKPAAETGTFPRAIDHDESCTREDNATPTTSAAKGSVKRSSRMASSNARKVRGKQQREPTEKSRQRIVKTIPGMRSSPEDFLCDTS